MHSRHLDVNIFYINSISHRVRFLQLPRLEIPNADDAVLATGQKVAGCGVEGDTSLFFLRLNDFY